MIEFFLKNTLPQHHGIDPDNVVVPIDRKLEPFTLVDTKACDDASAKQYNEDAAFNKYREVCSNCDRVVLRVDNQGKEVEVVSFEHYINGLPKKITNEKICDYLMTDGIPHNKMVFCDLCCYEDRYIGPNAGRHPEGKRAYARNQMERTVEIFMNINVLNQFILTFPEKVCLFAYRSYDAPRQPVAARRGNVESNMQAMFTTASTMSGKVVTVNNVMNHDFIFVQNRYPSVYNW